MECRLCSSKEIEIHVTTKDPDDGYYFTTDRSIGTMHCPLCGKRINKKDFFKDDPDEA